MKNRMLMLVVGVLVTMAAMARVASAEGWLPNLNPFGGKSEETSSSEWSAGGKKPTASQSVSRSKAEPSTWQKFSNGTSNAVSKTGSYLNPWHKEPTPAKPSGSRGYKTNTAKGASKSSGSTWYNPASWFAGEEPKSKKPETVSSFLGQSRPR